MDKSVDACTDFFEYANGTWLKSTEIPASETRWGSFNILTDNNNGILQEILEKAAAEQRRLRAADTQLIGDYYSSCMDEAAIEKAGIKPLEAVLSNRSTRSRPRPTCSEQIAAFAQRRPYRAFRLRRRPGP